MAALDGWFLDFTRRGGAALLAPPLPVLPLQDLVVEIDTRAPWRDFPRPGRSFNSPQRSGRLLGHLSLIDPVTFSAGLAVPRAWEGP